MPEVTPPVVRTRRPPRRKFMRLSTLSRRLLLAFQLILPLRATDGRRPPFGLLPFGCSSIGEVEAREDCRRLCSLYSLRVMMYGFSSSSSPKSKRRLFTTYL